jgi:hypothetical protein
MLKEKSPLCSQLFSACKRFLTRFRNALTCRCLHGRAYDRSDRVQRINATAPDCMCEHHRMSKFSPGVVQQDELLARFVFSPIHIDKKGRIKPSLFSHAENKGCSVQRDSVAETKELLTFVLDFLRKNPKCEWKSVAIGDCQMVRAIQLEGVPQRTVCVYDTAEKSNRAHGEIGLTPLALEDANANEMRRHLMLAFHCDAPISPLSYRRGEIWKYITRQ